MTSWCDSWPKSRWWLVLVNSRVKVCLRIRNRHAWVGKYGIWQQKGNHPSHGFRGWNEGLPEVGAHSVMAQRWTSSLLRVKREDSVNNNILRETSTSLSAAQTEIAECQRRLVTSLKPPSLLCTFLGSSGAKQRPLWLVNKETVTSKDTGFLTPLALMICLLQI